VTGVDSALDSVGVMNWRNGYDAMEMRSRGAVGKLMCGPASEAAKSSAGKNSAPAIVVAVSERKRRRVLLLCLVGSGKIMRRNYTLGANSCATLPAKFFFAARAEKIISRHEPQNAFRCRGSKSYFRGGYGACYFAAATDTSLSIGAPIRLPHSVHEPS
jgi:hypothetical protein